MVFGKSLFYIHRDTCGALGQFESEILLFLFIELVNLKKCKISVLNYRNRIHSPHDTRDDG